MFILQATTIVCLLLIGILPYTYGSWECDFQTSNCSWSTGDEQCSWKWEKKQLDGIQGYMFSTGQNRCTSQMLWQAPVFGIDGKPFSFLYRVSGNKNVTLTVTCAEYGYFSNIYHIKWSCNASPAQRWRKAHIDCPYKLDTIIIKATFSGKSTVMIGKIWNQNETQLENTCPPLPTAPTPITTTTAPTTTTAAPTTTVKNISNLFTTLYPSKDISTVSLLDIINNSTKMLNNKSSTHKAFTQSATNSLQLTSLLNNNTSGHRQSKTTPAANKVSRSSRGFTVQSSTKDGIISYSTTERNIIKIDKVNSHLQMKTTIIIASIFGISIILAIIFVIVWNIRRSKKCSKLLDNKTP